MKLLAYFTPDCVFFPLSLKCRQLLVDFVPHTLCRVTGFVPHTLYRGFAPGPHGGLPSPDPVFCGVHKILKLNYSTRQRRPHADDGRFALKVPLNRNQPTTFLVSLSTHSTGVSNNSQSVLRHNELLPREFYPAFTGTAAPAEVCALLSAILVIFLPAGCREAANCRYCFYSQAKNQVFRPAGATRRTDSDQTLQDRRAPGSAWLCKISRQSVRRGGNAAPKISKISTFW